MKPVRIEALPPLPDSLGFAGMAAGVTERAILCAGGANFSAKPMAEGGKRVWHSRVFALELGATEWREVGKLPLPRAYGVSGSWKGRMVIVGGNDGVEAKADGWLISWDGNSVRSEPLPPLPVPVTGACGTVVGDDFVVAGGQSVMDGPEALARTFACDLSAPNRTWRDLGWPEGAPGRVLAVAGLCGGAFHFMSGASLKPDEAGKPVRTYLTDAWRLDFRSGWRRLPDLPRPAAAGPSPAPCLDGRELVVVGGIWEAYLTEAAKAQKFPGFTRETLVYADGAKAWETVPLVEAVEDFPGRLVAPVVLWSGRWIVISGETKPGFRTPTVEVW